jgi:tetratricopeptide (TPR) repeat protein
MEALRRGDFGTAIPPLEQLTRLAPGVAEYHADLCVAYYSVGRQREAVAPCRRALKLKPALTASRYFLETSLAESGACKEALPMIEKDYSTLSDKQLRRVMGLDAARCAMAESESLRADNLLQRLNRDYPDDPDVLYLSARIYSDLSSQASERLLQVAPSSFQALQIAAETFEVEGRHAEALAEYRKIAEIAPQAPEVHLYIGRILLEGEHDAAAEEEAGRQFRAELALNPEDAGAEYELGEIARAGRQWGEAIRHFSRAANFDPAFPDALIGLGKSLVSAGRAAEAVAPLEKAVHIDPSNAVAHYQLSFAYRRVGREADAKRELAFYQDVHERELRVRQSIRQGLSAGTARPQTAEPPE